MTDYIIELYRKNERKPYDTYKASLPNGARPTYTDSKECFNYLLSFASKVKIKYASNGLIAAEKYVDSDGKGHLKWFKDPVRSLATGSHSGSNNVAKYRISAYIPDKVDPEYVGIASLETAKERARRYPNGTKITIGVHSGYDLQIVMVGDTRFINPHAPTYKRVATYIVKDGRLTTERKSKTEYGIKGKLKPFGL